MLRLALPVLAEQSLVMLVGLSDQMLTGRYFDAPHLAAINLMVYLMWMLSSLSVVIGIGATAMTARFVGAKDFQSARHLTNQAMLLAVGLAILVMIVGLATKDQIVALMQLRGDSAQLASQYLGYVFPVVPLLLLMSVGNACLRGAGDMTAGLMTMTLVNLVNIALSWSLVLGLGPLPKLGWPGLAIGTASGYAVGGMVMLGLLAAGRSGLKLELRLLRPDDILLRRLLRVGIPGGLDSLSVIACQLWFVAIINRLGDAAAAAHGVAIRIESLAYLPGLAFHVAAGTLAGQFLGAHDFRRAKRSVLMACLVGGGIVASAGALMFIAAVPLARLFLSADQANVATTAAGLLRIVSVIMPAFALVMILSGALRGAGDTRWPLMITWIGYLGVRIPLAYFFTGYLLLGVRGAWYAMVADICIRCVLVSYRFWQGGWQRIQV